MKKSRAQQEHDEMHIRAQSQLELVRAKQQNDISILLRKYFTYRIYLRFKKPFFDSRGKKFDSQHFYGHEHDCSYRQCLYGHVENIFLNKLQGFDSCVYMAEHRFKGLYHSAKIYARTVFPNGKFDVLCREYDSSNEIKEQQDPVIQVSDNRVLYFTVVDGMLELAETQPIDFKKEVAAALQDG